MRTILAVVTLFVLSAPVMAKPSHGPDTFSGDRYVRVAQSARDVTRSVGCPPPCQRAGRVRGIIKAAPLSPRQKGAPVPRPRPGTVAPLTLADGFTREVGTAVVTVRSHFIRGRLICAANVGQELARRGIKGTGSRLAKSYLSWGRSSGPQPGAVAVFSRGRGGHVAIVHSVKPNGEVIYLNPSARRQAWVIGPYRRKPIAYRVAS